MALTNFYFTESQQSSGWHLIEGGQDVVGELDLGDGRRAGRGDSDGESGDALLAERRIEDAALSVFLLQAHRAAEHAAEGHVLAEHHCRRNWSVKKEQTSAPIPIQPKIWIKVI